MSKAKQQIDAIRSEVETATDHSRPCPECGMKCYLRHGRYSGKFLFKHEHDNDCIYNQLGTAVFFKTREDAMKSTRIFWHESDYK